MKIYPLLLVFAIVLSALTGLSSQSGCLPDGITFTSQAQIDSFPINYPGCTVIEGEIKINGPDISSLEGLSAITSLAGNLKIFNNDVLTSLDGLEGLHVIQGDFLLIDNFALASIDALLGLNYVGGTFWLYRNHALTHLSGLENLITIDDGLVLGSDSLADIGALSNLTAIHGGLAIINNGVLENLYGLHNLADFSGSLEISENASLKDLSALASLTSIDFFLFLSENDSLENLHGLDQLMEINGDLQIRKNASLSDLSALKNLAVVKGELRIEENASLINLSGLDNVAGIDGPLVVTKNLLLNSLAGLDQVDPASIQYMILTANSKLSICSVTAVCTFLENDMGDALISGNAKGCANQLEVENACQALSAGNQIIDNEIRLFPNPGNGVVQINMPGNAGCEVSVWDALGQLVVQSHHLMEGRIDLSELPVGLYFLEFNDGQRSITKRIIKQ
ncbi:MAG: T9SS type A sorting domain-containing protein [Lewinellaceae bacterium]|nr:T9SS type A sorting domain-containing protein [Lewinellaceae bacterium]